MGQAALEKENILLTNVPDDYIAVSSGLGEAPPRNILVWPIVREDEVKAVIELGALEAFEDRDLELLSQINNNVAIAMDVAQSRSRLKDLLGRSRAQSEQLQIQTEALQAREEELTESNRSLSEKTAKLQASEESLQQQSEELQAANEELEGKTESLEKQKMQIEQAKIEVEEKAKQMELANKYKSEFLANMSHELRTPLNSLLILSKSLAGNDEGNLTSGQIEAANVIHAGGQELLTLINDILDLSKVESGKLEAHLKPINLRALADGLRSQFTPAANDKGLALHLEVADDLQETLVTDGQKVEQIIRNLFSNALKFTPTGSISLRVGHPDAGTRFALTDLTPESAVAFSVIDTGIGIPEDKLKSIFESFQQADGSTSRNYGGTGLGLTISREFAKLLGGEILLESRPGEGSTFTLCLPLAPTPKTHVASTPTSDDSAPPSTPRVNPHDLTPSPSGASAQTFVPDDRAALGPDDRSILIVEDDSRFARILIDLCHKKSFKCLAADTGSRALQMAAEYKPSAVLLDLGLPDMDGMVVLDELKNNLATRHIPVHIISGREMNVAALRTGAIGFLNKPVSSDDVTRALDDIEKLLHSTVKQLLVIEDDDSMRQLIADTVKIKDVEITEVTSGEEG